MIRFRSWFAHNKRVIKDAISKRAGRGARPDAPLMLGKILVENNFDDNFERFAALVGGDRAESFFIRALQYAATHDGINGTVRVSREHFGHVVLSRNWHVVSRKVGCSTYDALLSSGICVPISEGGSEPAEPFLSTPPSVDTSTPTSTPVSRLPVPVPVPVPVLSPHAPLPGGERAPSASESRNGSDKPLRPRVREQFARTITAAVRHGSTSQREEAERIRLRHENGELDDEDIEEMLAGVFAWVPRELANSVPAAPASPTTHAKLCGPHKRLLPCSVCSDREAAEKRRLNGTPMTSTPDIAAKLLAQIRTPATPSADPPKTRPEPPPGDAEMRKRIREAAPDAPF